MLKSTCLNYILREIDESLIRYILSPGDRMSLNVDQLLTAQVLDPILFTDMNLVGGSETVIESRYCEKIEDDEDIVIYHIPKALLGGKRILSVVSVYKEYPGYIHDETIPSGITDAEHIGGNNILIRSGQLFATNWIFRLNVEYSSNGYEVNRKAFPIIGQAAVLATKMKLYTKATFMRGKAMFSRGMSMDDVKSIVSDFSSAAEDYREFRDKRLKYSLIHADKIKKERHLRIITPANIR